MEIVSAACTNVTFASPLHAKVNKRQWLHAPTPGPHSHIRVWAVLPRPLLGRAPVPSSGPCSHVRLGATLSLHSMLERVHPFCAASPMSEVRVPVYPCLMPMTCAVRAWAFHAHRTPAPVSDAAYSPHAQITVPPRPTSCPSAKCPARIVLTPLALGARPCVQPPVLVGMHQTIIDRRHRKRGVMSAFTPLRSGRPLAHLCCPANPLCYLGITQVP